MTNLATVLAGVLLIDLGLMVYEFVVPLLAFQPHDGDVIRVIALCPMWWSFCSRRPPIGPSGPPVRTPGDGQQAGRSA